MLCARAQCHRQSGGGVDQTHRRPCSVGSGPAVVADEYDARSRIQRPSMTQSGSAVILRRVFLTITDASVVSDEVGWVDVLGMRATYMRTIIDRGYYQQVRGRVLGLHCQGRAILKTGTKSPSTMSKRSSLLQPKRVGTLRISCTLFAISMPANRGQTAQKQAKSADSACLAGKQSAQRLDPCVLKQGVWG